MRSSALFASVLGLAASALAADCAAQNIVDACVSGYQERIKGCQKAANDWICMCDVYTDVLTCYNNCPDSNEKPPVQNQVTQYCTAAEPYVAPPPLKSTTANTHPNSLRAAASSSMASVASVARTATTATPTSAAASATSGSATGSASAAASAFATGAAAAGLTTPAGAAVVALFAAAGLF